MYCDDLQPYHRRAIEKRCRLIKQHIPKIDILFDVGPAKIGTEAWILREMYPSCIIVGFEPHEGRYNRILHEYPGMLYHNPISDVDGNIKGYMGIGPDHRGNDFVLSWCVENEKEFYKEVEINSITLDTIFIDFINDFLFEIPNIDNVFIWADIQGSELKMLKGSIYLLKEKKVVGLNLELHKEKLRDWCTGEEVVEFLKQYNYIPIDYDENYTGHRDVLFLRGE